jgi:hypothetical protein
MTDPYSIISQKTELSGFIQLKTGPNGGLFMSTIMHLYDSFNGMNLMNSSATISFLR